MIERATHETTIGISLNLYGSGQYQIQTPIPFMSHMLEQLSKHSGFDLTVRASGDDSHHIIEDIGIVLGQAFASALRDKTGIQRFSHVIVPMDDALVMVALDISGRSYLAFDVTFPSLQTSQFETEWCREFFAAFLQHAKITLHIQSLAGINTHHLIECVFKAFALAIKQAVTRSGNALPSTKGVL